MYACVILLIFFNLKLGLKIYRVECGPDVFGANKFFNLLKVHVNN